MRTPTSVARSVGVRFAHRQPTLLATLDIDGLGASVVAQLGGGLDDEDFNNTFVEFQWPQ